jgi:RNA polymerase sigma-70 factor (ECF subfamily)
METAFEKEFQPERYRNYLSIWARYCLRQIDYLRPKLDASDLVQETLLQAHVSLRDFRGSTEREFVAWMREILQNKLWDAKKHFDRGKRDAKREEALVQNLRDSSAHFANRLDRIAAKQTTPSQAVVRFEKARILAEALAALPEDQRTALELHHLEDCSLQETAEFMKKTPASVAGLLRRGLQSMRLSLKEQEHDLL